MSDKYLPQLIAGDCPDPVVEANREMLLQRSLLGIRKYGVTLGDSQLTQRDILQHALEEALDLANYLQTEIMRLDGTKETPHVLRQGRPEQATGANPTAHTPTTTASASIPV